MVQGVGKINFFILKKKILEIIKYVVNSNINTEKKL